MAALRQPRYAPLEDWKQALLLFAVSEGFADSVAPGDMEEYAQRLYGEMEAREPELVRRLAAGKKLDEAELMQLRGALSRLEAADGCAD